MRPIHLTFRLALLFAAAPGVSLAADAASPWAPAPDAPGATSSPPAFMRQDAKKPSEAKPDAAKKPDASKPSPAKPEAGDAFLDENLLVAMPGDWEAVVMNDDPTLKRKHLEFTPKGETAQTWTNKITLQILHNAPIGAEAFAAAYKQRFEQSQNCEDASVNVLATGKQDGFDAALLDLTCPRNRRIDRGEYAMMQVIRGKDALYVLHRARRAAPFAKGQIPMTQEEHQDWLRFMKMAAICDTRDPKHPCPGQTPAPGARNKKPEREKAEKPAAEKPGIEKPADPAVAPSPAADKSEKKPEKKSDKKPEAKPADKPAAAPTAPAPKPAE